MTSPRELRAQYEAAKADGDRAAAAELGQKVVEADAAEFRDRPADRHELAAHRILARLDPDARRVMETNGRHYAELAARTRDLAARNADAVADRESSHAITAAQAARAGASEAWQQRQRMERARTEQVERWPGRFRMGEDEQQQWAAQAWPDHIHDRQVQS